MAFVNHLVRLEIRLYYQVVNILRNIVKKVFEDRRFKPFGDLMGWKSTSGMRQRATYGATE